MAYSKQFSAICPFFQAVKFSIFPSLKNLLLFSFYNFCFKKSNYDFLPDLFLEETDIRMVCVLDL